MKILVNLITSFRLICGGILILIFPYISPIWFLVIAGFLFLTDFIDGYLARKYRVQTFFGSLIDAVADKVLCITLTFPLLYECQFVYVILIGEAFIMAINLLGQLSGKYLKSIMIGKVKMWSLAVTIMLGYIYMFYGFGYVILSIMCLITFIFEVITSISYMIQMRNRKSVEKEIETNLLFKLFDTDYYLKTSKIMEEGK